MKWGNPRPVGEVCAPPTDHHTRPPRLPQGWTGYGVVHRTNAEAVAAYRVDLEAGRLVVTVADVRAELAGFDLACWCKLVDACHADVLLAVARGEQ